MSYWLWAVIALVFAIIAYDKGKKGLATLLYFITIILFLLEAVETWVGIGLSF